MTTMSLRWRTTFAALENRDYRWLWIGQLATSATMNMSMVVQGWLVYHLTNSAFALGWVGAGWAIASFVLSPYAGVITDRVDKRLLIALARSLMLLNSLALGLLVWLELIQVWHIAMGSVVTGITFAFLMPAQQSIISDLVDKETLLNAISLNAVGMGLTGIICASLAGSLIASSGAATVYFTMAAFYVVAVLTVAKLPKLEVSSRGSYSVWGDLIAGARYLWERDFLLVLLGLGVVRVLLVMPYSTLLPAFARDNLGMDSRGLGALTSVTNVGGMASALAICALGDPRGKGKALLVAGMAVGLAMMLFVSVPWAGATYLFIALVGACNYVVMVMNNTLLQSHVESAYRGRVLSVYMMTWGLTPLGTIPGGALADKIGVPWVVVGQGVLVLIIFALVAWRRPDMRTMD